MSHGTHTPAFLTGLLCGVGLMLLMSQAPQSLNLSSWGPSKKAIINLKDTTPAVPLGGRVSLFTVPNDQWLTITFANVASSNFHVLEVDSLGSTIKGKDLLYSGGVVGWTFKPGSQLVLENFSSQPGTSIACAYEFIGYRTRD